MQPPSGPPQNLSRPEEKPILSFEEFANSYNNFVSYFFVDTEKDDPEDVLNEIYERIRKEHPEKIIGMGENRRAHKFYLEFEQSHGELASSLLNMVGRLQKRKREENLSWSEVWALEPEGLKKLYEAYKLMRSYGASDNDLFA